MPKTGETHVFIFAEVSLDFLTLGGGFHDDEGATFVVSRGGGNGTRCGGRSRSGSSTRLDFELGWHYSRVCCSKIYKIRIQFYTCLDFFDLRVFFLFENNVYKDTNYPIRNNSGTFIVNSKIIYIRV
jgi:hypothetical protein